jgi:hypothetical protein
MIMMVKMLIVESATVLWSQGVNLYMRGVFEEETRCNLARPMVELMEGATSGNHMCSCMVGIP